MKVRRRHFELGILPHAEPLVSGVATLARIGNRSIGVTAAAARGGAGAFSYQWQYNWPRLGTAWVNASGPGVNTLAATIRGLGPASRYNLRLEVTDGASGVAYSNILTAATTPQRWFPGLRREPKKEFGAP